MSTEEQARDGVSLDAQRERLEAYALAHGAELASVEGDEGLSGKVPPTKRLGLLAALEAVPASSPSDGATPMATGRPARATVVR